MNAAAVGLVAPVRCTPWCCDGTGHPDAEGPDEQGCYSVGRRVELVRTPVSDQGAWSHGHLAVHLYRDTHPDGSGGAFLDQPHIEVYAGDAEPIRLSTAEARQLSDVLIELAETAQLK